MCVWCVGGVCVCDLICMCVVCGTIIASLEKSGCVCFVRSPCIALVERASPYYEYHCMLSMGLCECLHALEKV